MRLAASTLLLLLLFSPTTGRKMPTTRSMTASAEAESPLVQQAFAVFSGQPEHVAAPALLEVISMMVGGDEDVLLLDALPGAKAPMLTEEGRAWIGRMLVSCGFEMLEDGRLKASVDTLEQLRKEQNAARRRAHAVAEESREKLLTAQLAQLQRAATSARTLAQARQALRQFFAAFDGQPAVGPVLLGCAALMRAQATSGVGGQCWVLDRAAMLNGGDAFVKQSIPLLGALGVAPGGRGAEAAEEGLLSTSADEVALEVVPGAWTAAELSALAVVVERRCSRMTFGARASGRIEGSSKAYTPRECASWWDSLGSAISAWLFKLAP